MTKKVGKKIKEFLTESNYIENERTEIALEDSMSAWRYASSFEGRWTVDFVLEIHRILLKNINPSIAGKFRSCDVWIGGYRKMFISNTLLKEQVEEAVGMMNYESTLEKPAQREILAGQCHVAFEDVHPFEDGNGRVGRILWQLHRLKLGLKPRVIHEGEEQFEYYKWFKK